MKNEIGRKITSLTLMTIMLAGGITVGAQGFVPEAYADHNANLFVSAEKTGNSFDGLQIVEVVIIDEDLTGLPDVTVNGEDLAMTEATDGNHYAYFANNDVANLANIVGLDFGSCSVGTGGSTAKTGVTAPVCQDTADGNTADADALGNVIKNAKTPVPDDADWPFVQLFGFSGTAEIEYNRAGGAERTVLDFDDNSEGMTLDRATYPPGAEIHAIINDHRLNIDPTTADAWMWHTTDGTMYYNLPDEVYDDDADPNTADIPVVDDGVATLVDDNNTPTVNAVNTDAVCEGCSIAITSNGVIETDSAANRPVGQQNEEAIWVSVREISGPNTGIFATTDLEDNSTIQTTSDAQRDTAGVIDYDGTSNSIVIKHYTASISIDAPTDVWTSGLAIPIALTDDDANKNSLSDEAFDVSNPDTESVIPTLITGTPVTISVGETWVLHQIDNDQLRGILRILTGAATNQGTNDLINATMVDADDVSVQNGLFTVIGVHYANGTEANDVFEWRDANGDDPNFLVSKGDAGHDPLSRYTADIDRDRAIVTFDDIPHDVTNVANLDTYIAGDAIGNGTGNFANLHKNVAAVVVDLDSAMFAGLTDDPQIVYTINFDFSGLGDVDNVTILAGGNPLISDLDAVGTHALDSTEISAIESGPVQVMVAFTGPTDVSEINTAVVFDLFSFGFENDGEASGERIANQIVRLELEESSDNQGDFEGTLEYVMINQLNILDPDTYAGITPIGDEVSFVVIDDWTGSDAPTVTYLDTDAEGEVTPVSAKEDAPSHSGVVSLDVETFKVADTVTVTLEDLDLNVQSELIDIYPVVGDIVGAAHPDVGPEYLGQLLEVTFDDQPWEYDSACTAADLDNSHNGLGATGFSLVETTVDSGIFTGSFQIPARVCLDDGDESSTGLDIAVNYVDFRDASGETTEVSSDAGVKANTGSVSLDRTVYPVPFGPNPDGESVFAHGGGELSNGDLIVYVSVNDPDFDISASGEDSIAFGDDGNEPVRVTVSRGSAPPYPVAEIGGENSPITEISPDAGIFEEAVEISYHEGPSDSSCPKHPAGTPNLDADGNPYYDTSGERKIAHCILQGDILQVVYNDPTDASGESNTVTDSATFDLRNGVLQSDKSVYIIGSDMILTLIEPDFDLDSSQNETYDLDLIEWDSSAATVTMGNAGRDQGSSNFDPEPFSLRETGPNTGIFQVVVEIPEELGSSDNPDALERGEEIELIYNDWGPSGSEYVGDNDEEISLTVFTSNFGATVELDQKIYTWTDKVYITIVAPDHNFDSQLIDEIGEDGAEDELRIGSRENSIDGYRLVETGADTGIFTGEVILTGFDHPPIEYVNVRGTSDDGSGPTDGYLETEQDGGISVSYEFSGDETVLTSSLVRWNIGEVQWLEASYPASGNGILRIIDPDMSLSPEAVDNFDIKIASSSDASGIRLTVTETNEATGIFEGTVFFTTTSASSGHRLRIAEGDTVTAIYDDATLPDPYTTADSIAITATTLIGTIVPPLERAPASDLRVVDPFGNSLDTVSVDQQVQVSANLANGQDRDQDFAYLVQIQNSDGVTVALAWIAGSLSPGQSFSPAVSWIPTESGTYTVTAFVWESVDNPTALSPPVTIDVSVN